MNWVQTLHWVSPFCIRHVDIFFSLNSAITSSYRAKFLEWVCSGAQKNGRIPWFSWFKEANDTKATGLTIALIPTQESPGVHATWDEEVGKEEVKKPLGAVSGKSMRTGNPGLGSMWLWPSHTHMARVTQSWEINLKTGVSPDKSNYSRIILNTGTFLQVQT